MIIVGYRMSGSSLSSSSKKEDNSNKDNSNNSNKDSFRAAVAGELEVGLCLEPIPLDPLRDITGVWPVVEHRVGGTEVLLARLDHEIQLTICFNQFKCFFFQRRNIHP